MFGPDHVWDFVCAPFRWVIQMPFWLPLGLLLFGLAMLNSTKRNQKGLIFSISFSMTALLAVGWLNSRMLLTTPVVRMFQKMPLCASVPTILISAAGLGALAALATSFTQIKLNRYINLDALFHQIALKPDVDEDSIRRRCAFVGLVNWIVEAGLLFSISRWPHTFRAALPQALAQSPLRLILQGQFSLEVLFAAIAVAGACGLLAALFIPYLWSHETTLSRFIHALRMTAYLVLMVFASVTDVVFLLVAFAALQGLSARFVRKNDCLPEDCVPLSWFALEQRHCLLCGFGEADAISDQRGDPVQMEKISMLKCVHVLDRQDDIEFLQSDLSRDALWHKRFIANDEIVVCAHCRKVFYAEDFTNTCPLCGSHNKLWFSHLAALFMRRKTALPNGATTERLYATTLLSCIKEQKRHLPDSPSLAESCTWLCMPAAMYVLILLICV